MNSRRRIWTAMRPSQGACNGGDDNTLGRAALRNFKLANVSCGSKRESALFGVMSASAGCGHCALRTAHFSSRRPVAPSLPLTPRRRSRTWRRFRRKGCQPLPIIALPALLTTCRHEPQECRARPGPLQWPAMTAEQEMRIARQPVQLGNNQLCADVPGGFFARSYGKFSRRHRQGGQSKSERLGTHQRIIKARNHKPWQEGGRQNSEPGTKVFSWGTRMRSRQIR
jgi:hypothetical protein